MFVNKHRKSSNKIFREKKRSNNSFRLINVRLFLVPHRNAATVDEDVNAAKHLQSCFALSFQGFQLWPKKEFIIKQDYNKAINKNVRMKLVGRCKKAQND
jgi:hypothetical protein